MASFQDCTDNLADAEDDVYMRLFVQSLEGDARKWFRNLSANSIDSWVALEATFLDQWGEK